LLEFPDRPNGICHYLNEKVALFWIRIGTLGEFLLQTIQNDVRETRLIKNFSWLQRGDINSSDRGETLKT
jgi:hypothetical protein